MEIPGSFSEETGLWVRVMRDEHREGRSEW